MAAKAVDYVTLLFENSAPPMSRDVVTEGNNDQRNQEMEAQRGGWNRILLQILFPFLFAGTGMVFAGVLLDIVSKWDVYTRLPTLIALVTPITGIKGNLEMTLCSRLSTQANLGNLHGCMLWRICKGNLCMVQVHAIVTGLLSAMLVAAVGHFVQDEKLLLSDVLLMCTSAVVTTSITSFVLGCIMIGLVIICDRLNINPDNICTPLAGCLGDITTLFVFSGAASFFNKVDNVWACAAVLGSYSFVVPAMAYFARRNEFTANILVSGWPPLVMAVMMSSGGGFIMEHGQKMFPVISLYQPLINGIGGNLVSVYTSRVSTFLYKNYVTDQRRDTSNPICVTPVTIFFGKGLNSVTARVLVLLILPGQLLFLTLTYVLSPDAVFSAGFVLSFLAASTAQVSVLIFCANVLTRFLWNFQFDPDTQAIPLLTSGGDLIGSALLYVAFELSTTSST